MSSVPQTEVFSRFSALVTFHSVQSIMRQSGANPVANDNAILLHMALPIDTRPSEERIDLWLATWRRPENVSVPSSRGWGSTYLHTAVSRTCCIQAQVDRLLGIDKRE